MALRIWAIASVSEGRGSMVEAGLPPLHDVNSTDSVDSGCCLEADEDQRSDGQTTHLQNTQHVIWEIELPNHLVGRFIGKHGRNVNFFKQRSGAKVYVLKQPYTLDYQICHIEGTQQQVDRVLILIEKKFRNLDLTNMYCPPHLPITLPSLPMTTWVTDFDDDFVLPPGQLWSEIVGEMESMDYTLVKPGFGTWVDSF